SAGGLATPEVYATSDRLRAARAASAAGPQRPPPSPPPQLSTALMAALRSADPAAVGPQLSNDLQPAAPGARELAVSLTGAGVCRAVARVHGPVPGAAIITGGERG